MTNKLINTDKLTAIADAIRGKTGSTETYSVDGMVDAISNISGGGGDTSVEDGLIEGTLTGEYENDRVTKIRNYAFRDCSSLTTANLPSATSVEGYAFQNCSSLTTANLPVATSVGSSAFQNCRSLTTVDLPVATSVGNYAFRDCRSLTTVSLPVATSVGNYAFRDCSSLTTANLPVATSVGMNAFYYCSSLTTVSLPVATSVGSSAFNGCRSLTTVSLPVATSVGNYAFNDCSSLTTLILRNTTKVCTLSSTNAFMNCYHYHGTVHATYNPDGLQDGYIYVPASLIDEYKVATNWSTLATQFRALEDYTVDGTTTGELDESKI